jgi:hypothetical protein
VTTTPPLPTFVIIGAQKSATRWLRLKLGEHPQIFTANDELHFWNNRWRVESIGLHGYRALFEGWGGEPIVGEATPGYMMWKHGPPRVAHRMKQDLPDVRLLAILRNPIDRANSAMLHHIRRGRLPQDARLLDVVRERLPAEKDRLGLIAGGWYAKSLAPFLFRFGDGLLVLLQDEVVEEPEKPYEAALRHIGADPSFRPAELAEVVFSNRERPKVNYSSPSPEDREELWEYFRDDVTQLEEMLGRDLSRWRPGAAGATGTD